MKVRIADDPKEQAWDVLGKYRKWFIGSFIYKVSLPGTGLIRDVPEKLVSVISTRERLAPRRKRRHLPQRTEGPIPRP